MSDELRCVSCSAHKRRLIRVIECQGHDGTWDYKKDDFVEGTHAESHGELMCLRCAFDGGRDERD